MTCQHGYISFRSSHAYRRAKKEVRPAAAAILLLLAVFPVALMPVFPRGDSAASTSSANVSPRTAAPRDMVVSVRAAGFKDGYCNNRPPREPGQPAPRPTNFLKSANKLWLILLLPGVVFMFVGLAIVTDDYFVPSLERICERLNLSEDVAGATFMAAGSSAPELFTSLLSVFLTKDDVGIGTIVGSAVFNVLVIIGLSAALAGAALDLDFRPLLRDSFFYVISIVLLIVFVLFSTPGDAHWWEGLILMIAYVLYIAFMKWGNKPYFKFTKRWVKGPDVGGAEDNAENGFGAEAQAAAGQETSDEFAHANGEAPAQQPRLAYNNLNPRSTFKTAAYAVMAVNRFYNGANGASDGQDTGTAKRILGIRLPNTKLGWATFPVLLPWHLVYKFTIVDCSHDYNSNWWPLTFAVSILWISAISYAMVEGARLAGCFIGIPSAVLGLTFLAAGTSVPDALASVAVARNGQGDMAVSNAIGSNVFDILLGLGMPWFLAGLIFRAPQKVTIKPITTVVVPIAILLAIIIFLVAVLILLRWKLSKTLGYVLFVTYAIFFAYSLLESYVINKKIS